MAKLDNELRILLNALENAGVSTKDFRSEITKAGTEQEKLVKVTRDMQMALSDAEGSASNLFSRLQAITDELGKGNKALNRSVGAYNQITDVAEKLRNDEQGITDLNRSQVEKLIEKVNVNKKVLKDSKEELERQGLFNKAKDELTDKEAAILASFENQNKEVTELQNLAKSRLELEKAISKNMGVTGALVQGTGALMERLGMRSGIFHDAMKDAAEEMRRQSKILGENATLMDRLKIAGTGFSIVAKGFSAALSDPAVIIGKIIQGFFEVNKAQTEFIRLTGVSAKEMGGVMTEVSTTVDLLEQAAAFTKETGLNAATIFTPDQIGQLADATSLLGISSEQATNLGLVMKQTGMSADDIGNAIYGQVSAGISNKAVYDDILEASDDILASAGGNVEELGKAANAAKKLGMDLAKVNSIADGLLDFETSISNELEAQLLTGKNINLSKARELALNNNLAGLAEELKNNGASAAEFAKMNRIQQQELAEALGMSREELAKAVLTEEARADMTADQVAKARNMTLEQSKQLDIQERIKKATDKLAQSFAPILEQLVPIVELALQIVKPIAYVVGQLLKLPGVTGTLSVLLGGFAAVFALGKVKTFFKTLSSGFSTAVDGIKQFSSSGKDIKAVFDKGVNRFREVSSGKFISGDKAKELGAKIPGVDKVTDKITDGVDKTKKVDPKQGLNIKKFLKGLGDGLAHIGKNLANVAKGALGLGLAGIALGGSFALALNMIKDVDPVQMIAFAGSLTAFGLTLALLGKIGSSVIQGALAMAILGVGLIPAAYAFSLLSDVDTESMIAFSIALPLLGLAAAGLGFLAPFILAGAGAIAVLGAALIPAALAFKLLGDSPIESIVGKLTGLAQLAPQLFLVGGALLSIAAGLGAIAIAGVAAIPALGALSLLALTATPLLALGGLFEGDSEDDGFAKIEAKLDTLIEVISTGGDVYLDSDRIGRTQAKSFRKLTGS